MIVTSFSFHFKWPKQKQTLRIVSMKSTGVQVAAVQVLICNTPDVSFIVVFFVASNCLSVGGPFI